MVLFITTCTQVHDQIGTHFTGHGFQAIETTEFIDAVALCLSQVDNLSNAVLEVIVHLNTNIELVGPHVVDADGIHRVFVLQDFVNEEPEMLMTRGRNAQPRIDLALFGMLAMPLVLGRSRERGKDKQDKD